MKRQIKFVQLPADGAWPTPQPPPGQVRVEPVDPLEPLLGYWVTAFVDQGGASREVHGELTHADAEHLVLIGNDVLWTVARDRVSAVAATYREYDAEDPATSG